MLVTASPASPAASPCAAPSGILIASANAAFRQRLRREAGAREAREARSGADALAQLETLPPAALWLDRQLPDLEATELAAMVRRLYPAIAVRLVAAAAEAEAGWPEPAETAPDAAARAAAPEPELKTAAHPRGGVAPGAGGKEAAPLWPAAPAPLTAEALPGMHGSSPSMRQIFGLARMVAPRDTAVLITGESGTGKELVARAIHQMSRRAHQPWVVVNCAALPESLLEAELFGHARGAFTGAVQAQLGRIHAAHRGTLFLDEIGELPLSMQAKLLRFVQEGEVQRLGSPDVFRVDVRLLAATNADLERRVEEGRFRADLYYRLAVFPLELPPLRQRREDVPALAADLVAGLSRKAGLAPKPLSAAAADLLAQFPWPGNVRQLQHALERALILADGWPVIEAAHLPAALRRGAAGERRPPQSAGIAGHAGLEPIGLEPAGLEPTNRNRRPIGSQAAWA